MSTARAAAPRLLTGKFATWLGASFVCATGEGILYFGIGWTAASLGSRTAGLMLTLIVLPRALLMLVGGATGDRFGLRRTVIACDGFMCLILTGYLLAQRSPLPQELSLAGLAVALGVASAFRLPASGAFPRLFANDDVLARAMSLTSGLGQLARLIGPALGGVVMLAVGMAGAVTATLVGFVVFLVVCVAIRPPYDRPPEADGGSALRRIKEGLRSARRVPGVPALLTAVALIAAGVLPMLTLCVPLAARERGWSAGVTGLIEGVWVVGALSVTLLVARRGTRRRPLSALTAGPLLVSVGVLVIAASREPMWAMTGALVMGVGTAVFTTHVHPLYVLRSPEGMLARFQALLGVVQAAPLVIANYVLGVVATDGHAVRAMAVVAGLSLLAGLTILASPAVRETRYAGPE